MARPSEEERVRRLVSDDIARAKAAEPGQYPINLYAVSRRTGVHRATIKKYDLLELITRAAARQNSGRLTEAQRTRRDAADRLTEKDAELEAFRRRGEALAARLALVEGNAQRLNIDPSELYRPLDAPPRTIPHQPHRPRRRIA
jgi:hypothetical protein